MARALTACVTDRVRAVERRSRAPAASPTARRRPAARRAGPAVVARARLPGELAHVDAADRRARRRAGAAVVAPDLYALGDSDDSRPGDLRAQRSTRFAELDGRARARAGGARRPRLGRLRRPRLGLRSPRPRRGAGDQRRRLLRRRQVARDGAGDALRAGRGARRRDSTATASRGCSTRAARSSTRPTIDAYWAPFAGRARPAGDARVLPLDGLREARPVAGQARRAGRADAAALGRRGPVRAAGWRAPVRARDPGREARRDRGRRALRLRRAAASAASPRCSTSSARSPAKG